MGTDARVGNWYETATWIATGLLAALLLLWSCGWVLAAYVNPFAPSDAVPRFLYGTGQVGAALAAPVWACVAIRMGARGGNRIIWLAVGAVVLAPWPLLLGAR